VKEKEFASKSISSWKILSISEITIPVEFILTELYVRLLKYFERSKMVPKTLNLQKHRTKSIPLNLKRKTEDFKDLIFEKGMSLVNRAKENLFPCQCLTFSIKNFEKSDFDQFEYDLQTFFIKKELISEENSRSTEITNEEEEKIGCERCLGLIFKREIKEHMNFHAAEDLDRELNSNKKKYKNEVGREQNLELKKIKKTPIKSNEVKNIQKLDKFFCKK